MRLAVFPGSFDPFTLGHMDVLRRASALFDEVRVVVIGNPAKSSLFGAAERVSMIDLAIRDAGIANARAESFTGLTAKYAQSVGAGYIVRGLRSASDFEYEAGMEVYNRLLAPGVETVYLNCDAKFAHISSSAVRELLRYGADVGTLVPDRINQFLVERLKSDEQ